MTLSVKFRRIDITDEDQVNPTRVDVAISLHSTQTDVAAAHVSGSDEVGRYVVKCTSTRAAAQALLNTCNIQNDADLPSGVIALLVAAGMQNP